MHTLGPLSKAHKVLDDQQLQPLVIAGFDEALDLLRVDFAGDLDELQEDLLAVLQVLPGDLERLGAHRLDVQTDPRAVLAVARLLQDANLVERPAISAELRPRSG